MKQNIVILDAATTSSDDSIWQPLEKFGEVRIFPTSDSEEICNRIADADIVLTNKAPVGKEAINCAKRLRLICVLATGYNIIDLTSAKEHGITVCNVPGYSTDSVAQLTFALLLEITNRVALHNSAVVDGEWTRCGRFTFRLCDFMELSGKTLGIVGFGAIGRRVAEIGMAFGMRVITNSQRELPAGVQRVGFEQLLSQSDVLSLNSALTPDRVHLINSDALALMKPTAILINTARGGLIDERALADALRSGQIAAAGLDVLETEPPTADCPLIGLDNCVITPHIAWQSNEAISRLLDITFNNIAAFIEGRPTNVVN